MEMTGIGREGIVLLGCGKMGSALLEGWLARGLPATGVWAIDPEPSARLQSLAAEGLHLNEVLPEAPGIVLLAVKPQTMEAALPAVAHLGGGATLFVSIAAGTTIASLTAQIGAQTPVVRTIPNTPAAVGRGITAMVANAAAGAPGLDRADALLSAVGATVRLEDEAQIDAVTGVSGSGPAYVFHLIEALGEAGEAEGLSPEIARTLATATVAGAGHLAATGAESAGELRRNVTSPGGTTAAALDVLMDGETGFRPLLRRAVHAATARARELGG